MPRFGAGLFEGEIVSLALLMLSNTGPIFNSASLCFLCLDLLLPQFKKLDMMTDVANASNVKSIVEELAAYVTDIDVEIARRSVRSVGHIACKMADSRQHCISVVCNVANSRLTFSKFFFFFLVDCDSSTPHSISSWLSLSCGSTM